MQANGLAPDDPAVRTNHDTKDYWGGFSVTDLPLSFVVAKNGTIVARMGDRLVTLGDDGAVVLARACEEGNPPPPAATEHPADLFDVARALEPMAPMGKLETKLLRTVMGAVLRVGVVPGLVA